VAVVGAASHSACDRTAEIVRVVEEEGVASAVAPLANREIINRGEPHFQARTAEFAIGIDLQESLDCRSFVVVAHAPRHSAARKRMVRSREVSKAAKLVNVSDSTKPYPPHSPAASWFH
jgi:hypothetical protein